MLRDSQEYSHNKTDFLILQNDVHITSDFLLSQYVRKLSLHSVLLFFSNEGDL